MDEEPGVYSGSGYVRVDRRKALELLRGYQLPDPGRFVGFWVRAAVASRATAIRVRTSGWFGPKRLIEVRFDGIPFTAADLADPYGALFSDEPGAAARGRDLALGLLAALRLSPRSVEVRSGAGKERRRLRIESLEKDSVDLAPDRDYETIIAAELGPGAVKLGHLALPRPEQYALCPAPIWVNGVQRARPGGAGFLPGLEFRTARVRGRLTIIPPGGEDARGTIRLYQRGVYVCELEPVPGAPAPVEALVEADDLAFDASCSSVVRDGRLDSLLKLLGAESRRLLMRVAREGVRDCESIVRLMAGPAALLALERERLFEGIDWILRRFGAGGIPGRLSSALRAADTMAWLRTACSWGESEGNGRWGKSLREAPLFIDVSGRPVNLRRLEDLRRRLGFVPYARRRYPRAVEAGALHCFRTRDVRWLQERFSEGARRMDSES